MSLFTKRGVDVFAGYDGAGNARTIDTHDVQVLLTELETLISAVTTAGGVLFSSKATMDATLTYAANTPALVIGDATTANNGLYRKSGTSGAGSWIRAADVPGYSFVRATNAGAGTANAIVATTAVPVNESQLITLPIVATNTTTPVAVAFNGGSALTIKTNAGNNPAAGGLTEGMVAAGYISGATFRLLSDQASAAIQTAAEAAQTAAEAAQVAAEAAANQAEAIVGFDGTASTVVVDPPAAGAGNVQDALETLGADGFTTIPKLGGDVVSRIDAASGRSVRARVWDFHFGCARGVGFRDGYDTGLQAFTLSAPASAGALSFSYSGTAPNALTVIVILGTDGEYYTVTVNSASGGTCSLRSPLPVNVAAGQNAWSFWNDDAHPNAKGFAAIVDYALRQDMAVWKKVVQQSPMPRGGASVEAGTANNGFNIGSESSGYGWNVTPIGADTGCKWIFTPSASGVYRAVFQISRDDPASANVAVAASQGASTIGVASIATVDAGRHEIDFAARAGLPVTITATRAADLFTVSNMVILTQIAEPIADMNWGTHVILGDSWVSLASGGVVAAMSARLDRATIIDAGNGGDTAEDALVRFDSAAAPVNPDFVWIIVSTNDIASGVNPATFAANLGAIIARCQTIGAIPIVMTPFTGPSNQVTWIDHGRTYYSSVPFYETEVPKPTLLNISANVPAGATVPVMSLGIQSSTMTIVESYLTHSLVLKEYSSQPANSGTTLATLPDDWVTTPVAIEPNPAGRFVQFMRTAGGSDEYVSGYVRVHYL